MDRRQGAGGLKIGGTARSVGVPIFCLEAGALARHHNPCREPGPDGRRTYQKGKVPTALERSGGAGVSFILDPAHPAGSQLSSIAVVVEVSGRDGREMASGLLLSCFWKDER